MLMTMVQLDEAQLKEAVALLTGVRQGVPKAASRAINKTADSARTKIVRRTAEEIALGPQELRQRNIRLTRATYGRLLAHLLISGRRIPLIRFGAAQVRHGVTYRIRRSGGREEIPSAFLPILAEGHRGVFVRTGPFRLGRRIHRGRGPGAGMAGLVRPRLPITERYGPSVPQVVSNIPEFAQDILEATIAESLERNFNTQIQLVLEGRVSPETEAETSGD
jgi:hypothetical protein